MKLLDSIDAAFAGLPQGMAFSGTVFRAPDGDGWDWSVRARGVESRGWAETYNLAWSAIRDAADGRCNVCGDPLEGALRCPCAVIR